MQTNGIQSSVSLPVWVEDHHSDDDAESGTYLGIEGAFTHCLLQNVIVDFYCLNIWFLRNKCIQGGIREDTRHKEHDCVC